MEQRNIVRNGEVRFSVSVKGVLEHEGKLLLRRNQREEFELPGGRLEPEDISLEQRLTTEFREESGIRIEVLAQREPWLYEVGGGSVLIVPFLCRALEIPEVLTDEDGGTLHWLRPEEAEAANMPLGYKDTIRGTIPHRSASAPSGEYFKIIPNYVEPKYRVRVCVRRDGVEILSELLPRHQSPREFLLDRLGGAAEVGLAFEPVDFDRRRETVVLNYCLRGE